MERLAPGKPGIGDPGIIVQHLSRYAFALNFTGKWGLPVLDAASGAGYGLSILSMRACQVVGAEISDEAIEQARKLYYYCPSQIIKCDLEREFPRQPTSLFYGAITSFETIEHLENPQFFLKNVYNCLWDDGYFVFSIPRTGVTLYHKVEYPYFDKARLLIEEFFDVEKWYGQNHQVGDVADVKEAPFWFGVAKKKHFSSTIVKFKCSVLEDK